VWVLEMKETRKKRGYLSHAHGSSLSIPLENPFAWHIVTRDSLLAQLKFTNVFLTP
jgi:hypothetical protein